MRQYMAFGLFCMIWVSGVVVAKKNMVLTATFEIPLELLSKPFSITHSIPIFIRDDGTVSTEAAEAPTGDVQIQASKPVVSDGVPSYAQLDDLHYLPQEKDNTKDGWQSIITDFFMDHPYVSFGGVVSLVWFILASLDPELRHTARDTVKKVYKKVQLSVRRAYRSVSS